MFTKSDNGVTLLVASEMAWCSLYAAHAILSAATGVFTLLAMALPILTLASADCGLWVLALVYYNQSCKAASHDLSGKPLKFLFRTGRLMLSNRFVL